VTSGLLEPKRERKRERGAQRKSAEGFSSEHRPLSLYPPQRDEKSHMHMLKRGQRCATSNRTRKETHTQKSSNIS